MSIKVMSRIWDESEHNGSELLTMLALADWSNDAGVCWPGMDALRKKTRMSERQQHRIVTSLMTTPHLHVEKNKGPHGTNLYFITTGLTSEQIKNNLITYAEMSPVDALTLADEIVKRGCHLDTPDAGDTLTSATPGGDAGDTQSIIDPSEEDQEPLAKANGAASAAHPSPTPPSDPINANSLTELRHGEQESLQPSKESEDPPSKVPAKVSPALARVVHVHSQEWCDTPDDQRVYIGRPMPQFVSQGWGNPFKVDVDGTREEVIAKYRAYITGNTDLLVRLPELRGKVLGCWCKPSECHGDVLAELVNASVGSVIAVVPVSGPELGPTPKSPGIAGKLYRHLDANRWQGPYAPNAKVVKEVGGRFDDGATLPAGADIVPPEPKASRGTTEPIPDDVGEAFAVLCYHAVSAFKVNYAVLRKAHAKMLKVGPVSVSDIRDFGTTWNKNDWRGKKGQPPTPWQVAEGWPTFKEGKNGNTQSVRSESSGLESTRKTGRVVVLPNGERRWEPNTEPAEVPKVP